MAHDKTKHPMNESYSSEPKEKAKESSAKSSGRAVNEAYSSEGKNTDMAAGAFTKAPRREKPKQKA